MRHTKRRSRWLRHDVRNSRLLLVILCVMSATGCVRRRLFVNSNPPGALVYVDNTQIGPTPAAVDFTYYGTREIRLVKPGYETLTVNQPIPIPWYQFPGLDFVSENLVPYKIRDHRNVSYNLTPQVIVPTEELIARGNQLRQDTLQGTVVPTSAVGLPGNVPATFPSGGPPANMPVPQGGTNPAFAPPSLGPPESTVLPAPPGPLSPSTMPGVQSPVGTSPPLHPGRDRTLVSPALR